jgi:hypothetical protein
MPTEANQIKWYFSIRQAILTIDESQRDGFVRLYRIIMEKYPQAPASDRYHHNWHGGYLDYLCEIINIAYRIYLDLNNFRNIPFKLKDIIPVLLLQDIDKPWQYAMDDGLATGSKVDRIKFREQKMREFNIELTDEQASALEYIDNNGSVAPNPIGAICISAITLSVGLFPQRPFRTDTWGFRHHDE